jgi:hypothetical protein
MHTCVSVRLQRGCIAVTTQSDRRHWITVASPSHRCRIAVAVASPSLSIAARSFAKRKRRADIVRISSTELPHICQWCSRPVAFWRSGASTADSGRSDNEDTCQSMVQRLWLDHDSAKLNSSAPSSEEYRVEALHSSITQKAQTTKTNMHNSQAIYLNWSACHNPRGWKAWILPKPFLMWKIKLTENAKSFTKSCRILLCMVLIILCEVNI